MRFTWDPRKSAGKVEERGFDVAFAAAIFTGPTVERIDTRRDYGEVRRIAVGRFASVVLTVVCTESCHLGRHTRTPHHFCPCEQTP